MPLKPADAILVLGSLDTRAANRAAELYNAHYAPTVIVSGGFGKITKHHFDKPEAHVLADIMIAEGVPKEAILIEDKATNTGENFTYSYALLQKLGRGYKTFIVVQKPYMERRTYATFKKMWPDPEAVVSVTSVDTTFTNYCEDVSHKERVIHLMVGDLQRMHKYPKMGYMIEQPIPAVVWHAYEFLVDHGYTKHLI